MGSILSGGTIIEVRSTFTVVQWMFTGEIQWTVNLYWSSERSDGKPLPHLLKSRIAITMMMMSTTARTGPMTQSISGFSILRCTWLSSTTMRSEYGLDEKVRYREREIKFVLVQSNNIHNSYGWPGANKSLFGYDASLEIKMNVAKVSVPLSWYSADILAVLRTYKLFSVVIIYKNAIIFLFYISLYF